MTYTLAREIELLCFQFWEDFQELLHKANQLSSKVVLILGFAKYHLFKHQGKQHTLMLGFPCENPVPTGCSTQRTLDKLVQLNSLSVGFA
jgi:hypothetical protein